MNDKVTLPKAWQNKFRSDKLKERVSDIALWVYTDPTSTEGRKRLRRNEILFHLADSLKVDFAFEPNENNDFELIPASVAHQGIGITVSSLVDGLELDVYFFPCDYSEDPKRKLPLRPVRVPVVSTQNAEYIRECVEVHFPMDSGKQMVTIPFSISRMAVLEGNFIDEYGRTERICRNAVKGGSDYEIKNCERFLEFVKNVGLQ